MAQDLMCSLQCVGVRVWGVHGYLAHEKTPTPLRPPSTLGIGLWYGPRGWRFLMISYERGTPMGCRAQGSTWTVERVLGGS